MGLASSSLEDLNDDLEFFTRKIMREQYLNGAGLKEEMNLTSIYQSHRHLFEEATLRRVAKWRHQQKTPDQQRLLRYLQAALVSEYMENSVKELSDEYATMEAKSEIGVGESRIAFRESAVRMANEEDRAIRSSIFQARNKLLSRFNPLLRKRMRRLHGESKHLGYENYYRLYADIMHTAFKSLAAQMNEFLVRTRNLYVSAMSQAAEDKIHVSLKEMEKHDVAHLIRAVEFDGLFPKEALVPTLKATLRGLGIDIETQPNIRLDIGERPKKSPRAFMAPLNPPNDVVLVLMPKGGHDDYGGILHESGHAEHFGFMDASLPVEFKYYGDGSVSEAYAFLFEYLMNDDAWLQTYMHIKNPKEYLKFAYLYKLYFLRRYAGKLNYEIELHTQGLRRASETYKHDMEEALVFKHPATHYLTDLDDAFYTAEYLRAWIFEAQLNQYLKEEYGELWFLNPESGKRLRELWRLGNKYDVVELAQSMGFSGLDLEPITKEIMQNLKEE